MKIQWLQRPIVARHSSATVAGRVRGGRGDCFVYKSQKSYYLSEEYYAILKYNI
jgi:hypothetical protein